MSIVAIVIVALLIYEFLVLIRGTRAIQMLVGVGVLIIAFYLARFGELRTLNWLISNTLPYAIFALIVVFQAEIRQALAKVGRKLTFTTGTVRGGTSSYEDVVL